MPDLTTLEEKVAELASLVGLIRVHLDPDLPDDPPEVVARNSNRLADLVKELRAALAVSQPGQEERCTCPSTIGGERVENLSCPVHSPPQQQEGLTPLQAKAILVGLDFGVPEPEPKEISEAKAVLRALAALSSGEADG